MADAPAAFYEAINEGRLGDAAALLAEAVTWSRPPDVPITGTIEGRSGVERMWVAATAPLTSFEIEPTRVREIGDGVLVHVTFRGTHPAEGSFEFAGSQTFRFDADGLIAEVREFKTVGEGESDLGLADPGG